MNQNAFVSPDAIRARFSLAMSAMYQSEVPLYGDLLDLVGRINRRTLDADPALAETLCASGELQRLAEERHGAIRLGSAEELATMARLFAVMGMQPVAYYDLSCAGVPVPGQFGGCGARAHGAFWVAWKCRKPSARPPRASPGRWA